MEDIIFTKMYHKANDLLNGVNEMIDNEKKFKTDIVDLMFEIPGYYMVIFIFISFIIYFIYSKLEIRLNDILIYLIIVTFFYIVVKYNSKIFYNYIKEKDSKLDFLHKLMFNTKNWSSNVTNNNLHVLPENYFKKSYLYTNPSIIDLYYNARDFSQYNIQAFVGSLIHTNNILKLSYEAKRLKRGTYQNYTVAIEEMNAALNEYATVIFNCPLSGEYYKKIRDSITLLRALLTSELEDMDIIFKNTNKTEDITVNSYPDDFYDVNFIIAPNDTKAVDFMANYNMY